MYLPHLLWFKEIFDLEHTKEVSRQNVILKSG